MEDMQMTCSAVHPEPTNWEEKVGGKNTVVDGGTVSTQPEPPSFSNRYYAAASNIYAELISVDELRLKRLIKERKIFGIASLVMLVGLLAAMWAGLPYEPFAAILLCVLGIFVVFAMKVRDAKR